MRGIRRMSGPLVGLTIMVMAAGCASTQEAGSLTDDLVGCYQFERTESATRLGLGWGVELLEEPLEGPTRFTDARRAVSFPTPDRRADVPFNYWQVVDSTDVRVGFDGRGAISLDLSPEGRTLTGTGISVGDAMGPDETPDRDRYPVVAQRVICPGTP